MAKNIILRGAWYHYMRRVPKHLSHLDRRRYVRIALKTTVEKEAERRAAIYDDFIERYWRDLVKSGREDGDLQQYEQARTMAMAHGFAYKDMTEIASGSLEELLGRVEVLDENPRFKAKALLGAVKPVNVSLEQCIEKFWPLCSDRLVGRSELQTRKYMTPRNAAMRDFIKAVGNLDLAAIDRSHVLKFRNWLMERVARQEITGHTANKQLRQVKDMLWTVGRDEQIETDFKHLFVDTRLTENIQSRPPFEPDFVQANFLCENAFGGMNEQARMLIYMMVETGARESELIGLLPADYFLEADIPHIWIRENRLRSLKTKNSERKIPLVGVSLEAARRVATTGLERYQKNPDSASAAIGKHLREKGLKPTPRHSLYSLRHTFKDRLRDIGAPEEVIDELMGHKKVGPKYGRGHLLEKKLEWLQQIAFMVPMSMQEKRP